MIPNETSDRQVATGDFPVHHFQNNTFFCRYGSGLVHVAKFGDEPSWTEVHRYFNSGGASTLKPEFEIRIGPDQWASITAAMSRSGESAETFQKAKRLHDD